jgi:hypothetical protein
MRVRSPTTYVCPPIKPSKFASKRGCDQRGSAPDGA